MFRYIALAWNSEAASEHEAIQLLDRQLKSSSPDWHEIVETDGLRVYCADTRSAALKAHVLPRDYGAILGTIFRRNADPEDDTPARVAHFTDEESALIARSRGQRLVNAFWGNYVAFIIDPQSRTKWIVKDPTGMLPCFMTTYRNVSVFFSCAADCAALRLMHFSVNWDYVRENLVGAHPDIEKRALNEVSQILRGECLELDASSRRVTERRLFYWNPLSFSESDETFEDPARAARALRATIRSCSQSWAALHKAIVLRLSGGLDSSVVLGSLKYASPAPHLTCYTYFNPRCPTSARDWARLAAQDYGRCEHFVMPLDPMEVQLAPLVLGLKPSIEPESTFVYLQRTPERLLCSERDATAIFTGYGGDSGFGRYAIGAAAEDYLRRRGVTPRYFSLCSQIALNRQLSAWQVIARSLRRYLLGSTMRDQKAALFPSRDFVRAELSRMINEGHLRQRSFPHPWFRSLDRMPTGTVFRLQQLLSTPEFYDPSTTPADQSFELISPLLSQPVVELCLRIPTYTLFHGGVDRGLARAAFSGDVPAAILARHWKDRAPGFAALIIDRNRPFIREYLLAGVLAKENILDLTVLEEVLSGQPTKREYDPSEVLRLLNFEVWLRQWTSAGINVQLAA